MRCKLVLLVTTLLALSTAALADSREEERCQRMLSRFADDHLKGANRQLERHEDRVADEIDNVLRRADPNHDIEPSLRSAITRIEDLHDIVAVRAEYVDDVVQTLQEYGDRAGNCPSRYALEYRLENALANYEHRLERLFDDIRDRLDVERLLPDDGLAIIAFYSYGLAERVRINRRGSFAGQIEFGPVNNDLYFRVVRVKAGRYNWRDVTRWETRFDGDYRYTHDYSDSDFSFNVEAGKLNYTGMFVYDLEGRMARGSLNDRPTLVLMTLEERFPELLDRFEVANGLVAGDRYIDYYLEQRRLHRSESTDEN